MDYSRYMGGYTAYQNSYRTVHEELFGPTEADALYGNAIFYRAYLCRPQCAGVERLVDRSAALYETNEYVRTIKDTGHIAEQQALNRILHRTRAYKCLTCDMNWHCHAPTSCVRTGS
jgi:hypothetical protein